MLQAGVLVDHELDELPVQDVFVLNDVLVKTLESTSNMNHGLISSHIAGDSVWTDEEQLVSDVDDRQVDVTVPNDLSHSLVKLILPRVEVDRHLLE